MFGLMRAGSCGQHPEEKHRYRMHYCGTCKTMGSLYGQASRLLLNNDAVFFGELLTALSPVVEPVTVWDISYQSYNCFSLPDDTMQMPLSLQIAAAATLMMSEFKVADQIADGSGRAWKMALRVYSPGFQAASERLRSWGFPVDEITREGRGQEAREAEANAENRAVRTAPEWLDYLGEPTAAVTGIIFRHGALTVGNAAAAETMYELGHAFGQLVYLLDAHEDFEKDTRRGDFNALRAAFAIGETGVSDACLLSIEDHLQSIAETIASALHALPIPSEHASRFAARLNRNLDRKIGCESCETTPAPPVTRPRRTRGRDAVVLARNLMRRERETTPAAWNKTLAAPFVFVAVLGIAFLAPRYAAGATSSRECLDLSLNLMAVGAMIGTVLSAPARLLRPALRMAAGGSGRGTQHHGTSTVTRTPVRRRRPRPCGCDSCDSCCVCGETDCYDVICCCQGTECCCEGIQCCECCTAGECCGACNC